MPCLETSLQAPPVFFAIRKDTSEESAQCPNDKTDCQKSYCMGICLGINPEIQNKPADPYDNRKCSGMRIFQDLKLFFFCFIRTECICCIQKTIQMDPSGQNRDRDPNCCKRALESFAPTSIFHRSRSSHSPRLPEKADTVLPPTFFCPPAALGSSEYIEKQRTNFFLYSFVTTQTSAACSFRCKIPSQIAS